MRIAAVVVTYKNLILLKDCIKGIREQIYKVDQIIVVNNGGEDETAEWLEHQYDINYINQKNSGGAGGFKTGIKLACENNAEWIWCLDHDIIPNTDTLSNLINSNVAKSKDVGFLSSLVFFNENEIAYTNVPLLPTDYEIISSLTIDGELPILCSSFGSVLISRNVISVAGLPIQDFFIWGDDSEYTIRIIEMGFKGYLIMNSTVYHRSKVNVSDPLLTIELRNFRTRIGIRNKVYLIKLRNKLLYDSIFRGSLASLNYTIKLLKVRLKNPRSSILLEVYLILKYFIQGLFYKPRKHLQLQIQERIKEKRYLIKRK